jgi:hypothetical protein
MYSFPMTAHEMAHQMGYASESECNFIGFLASVKNDNLHPIFRLHGFYCLSNWQTKDRGYFKQLLKTVHPGILKTRKASSSGSNTTRLSIKVSMLLRPILKVNQQKTVWKATANL